MSDMEKIWAKQLDSLLVEWNPQGETEKMHVKELHHFLLTHNHAGAKATLASLVRVQALRKAKTAQDIAQAVANFNK